MVYTPECVCARCPDRAQTGPADPACMYTWDVREFGAVDAYRLQDSLWGSAGTCCWGCFEVVQQLGYGDG